MTAAFEISYDQRFWDALRAGPAVLEKHMGRAINRSIHEMGRTSKDLAPKAHSHLVNSINAEMVSPLEGIVAPGMDYAEAVEKETGTQGVPPEQSIIDWLKVSQIEPNDPDMDIEDLAFVIARSIAAKGTEAQPYIEPSFEQHKAATERRLDAAVDATLAEMARRH